jgi:two-component system LytT family sensor kinase
MAADVHHDLASAKTARFVWNHWTLFLCGWAVLSLLLAPEAYVYFRMGGTQFPWRDIFSLTAVNGIITLLFLPAIIFLAHRFNIDKNTWRTALPIHLGASLLFSLSHSGLYWITCYTAHNLGQILFFRFHPNLITYWTIIGFTHAIDYFQRCTQREKELAQAELLLMKAQLQPHFLFNTLHAISAMMHEDVKAADEMINELSELLRLALNTIGSHEVPLRYELQFIEKYVNIQRARFDETFNVDYEISPAVLDALVPAMILQPLVENSIKHGLDDEEHGGRIVIRAYAAATKLSIIVSDNGKGLREGKLVEGLGLSNSRERLQQLYGSDHNFVCRSAPQTTGFEVAMEIPLREAELKDDETIYVSDTDTYRGRRAMGSATSPFTSSA